MGFIPKVTIYPCFASGIAFCTVSLNALISQIKWSDGTIRTISSLGLFCLKYSSVDAIAGAVFRPSGSDSTIFDLSILFNCNLIF